MNLRKMLKLLAIPVCFFCVGCGGGGGGGQTQGFREDWDYIQSAKWEVTAGIKTVGGRLTLTSSSDRPTEKGSEIHTVQAFELGRLDIRAMFESWRIDSSTGYESWDPNHRGILVTGGAAPGGSSPLGHMAVINHPPETQEIHQPLPNWETIKGDTNMFSLRWSAEQVALYVNDVLSNTCTSADLPLPQTPLTIRLNASNDYADVVHVDSVAASDTQGNQLFEDTFVGLDPAVWTIGKGSSATNWNGWLSLIGSQYDAAQVQRVQAFLYRTLVCKCKSDKWASDTSIAWEIWDSSGHHAVKIVEGHLRIISPNGQHDEPLQGWDAARGGTVEIRLDWKNDRVEASLNGQPAASYSGDLVPSIPLKVRLNAAIGDRLEVDYVEVP